MSALDIRRTLFYPHPVEQVWHALTDSDAMAQWLMPNDFAPQVGHAFTLRMDARPGWNGQAPWFWAYMEAIGDLIDGQPEVWATTPVYTKGI